MSLKEKLQNFGSNKKRFLIIFSVAFIAAGAGFFYFKKSAHPPVNETHALNKGHDSHAKTESQAKGHEDSAHQKQDMHQNVAATSHEENKSHEMDTTHHSSGVFSTVTQAVHRFSDKVVELREADIENKRLKHENLNLSRWVEELQMNCSSDATKKHQTAMGIQLDQETGTQLGRVLSTIEYRPPMHLLPEQLFTLGVTYFKAGDFERSAVIFTYLTGVDTFEEFKTSQNYLMTGVAWFKLDHVKLSNFYLDKVLAYQPEPENMKSQAQARLWKALAAKRLNDENGSQHWLRQLIGHHPQAVESSWVNTNELIRLPSSTDESE